MNRYTAQHYIMILLFLCAMYLTIVPLHRAQLHVVHFPYLLSWFVILWFKICIIYNQACEVL